MKKKNYFSLAFRKLMVFIFLTTIVSGIAVAQWQVYDASVLPNENVPPFGTSGLAGDGMVSTIIADTENPGNSLLELLTIANADNGTWRRVFSEPVTAATIVFRIKAANTAGRRVVELDFDNGGFRERLYLNQEDNKLRFQHSAGFGADNEFSLPDGGSVSDWHIYRMTKDAAGNVKLYVDENPTPLAEGQTAVTSSNNHFRIGDTNGSHNISALIDWIIWDPTGTYAPGQGTPIPAELLPGDPEPTTWTIYDASVLPNAFVPVFITSSGTFLESENQIINDPETPGNKLLWMDVPGMGGDNPVPGQTSFLWRQNFAAHDVIVDDLTLVMRVKGHPGRDMALDLDMDYNGIRTRVTMHSTYGGADNIARVRNGTGSTGNTVALPVDVLDWNTYRFSMNATETKVYVNENPDPVMIITPVTAGTNRHFRFGDGDNSATLGADYDWIIWDVTGSFAPGEGSPLPDFSYTPGSDASLADIHADGDPIEGFDPTVYNYELVLPTGTTDVPVISAIANDTGATLDITQADAIPGTATIEVTAENGFTTRTYTVEIRLVSTDATLEEVHVDGEILADFDPDVLLYTVILPEETTSEIPVVSAIATDENAMIVITQATEMEGTATIVVTAEDETTSLTYTLNFVVVSVDATLSDLLVDGTTIEGFDPEVTEYTFLLAVGTTDVPVVTAVVNNENATMVITQAVSVPGEATVVVTAEDSETIFTYTIYFLTGSDDSTLADLMVDGVTIDGFNPDITSYEYVLPAGTTDVPVVSAAASDANAEVEIVQADAIPGTATVTVTAEDEFTVLVYSVHFRLTSVNASLANLMLDGNTIPGFNPEELIYGISMPHGSVIVPEVSALAAGTGATVSVTQAAQIPGAALVVVTAEDNVTSHTYTVNFTEADYDWRYYDASVLPAEHVPTFSPSNVGGSGGLNAIVSDPDDDTNSFFELITVENGDNHMWSTPLQPETPAITLVMKVRAANDVARRVVELDVHHNGIRERMYINREMNRVRLNEGIGGGDGGEIEAPEGVDLNEWNIYRLTKEGNETKLYLNENPEPIALGTTTTNTTNQYFRFGDGNGSHNSAVLMDWIVWDETGAYAPGEGLYIPAKVVTPDWDASLTELLADGALIEGFDPEITDYEFVYTEEPADIPVVSAALSNPAASLLVTQANEFPGVATAEVTAVNGFTVRTYTVTFRYISSDATLSDILVNTASLEGFNPDVMVYNVVLPAGTTAIPIVDAVANDANAEIDITQPAEVEGTATILVTAEDGTEVTYTLNFSVFDDTSVSSPEVPGLRLYPNPATTQLTIGWGGNASEAYVEIISLTGQILYSTRLESHSETISVSNLQQGTYIIRITAGQNRSSRLFMKQ